MMAAHQFDETHSERALAIFAEIEHGPYGRLSRDAYWAAEGHKSRPAGTPQVPRRNVEAPAHPAEFDPERERIAEAVLTVHAAIMNGGFLSAFDVAGHAIPDAIHGDGQIGLDQVAVLLQAGAAPFPGGIVPQDPAERQRLVDDVIDARALEELGTAYDDLVPDDELLNDRLDGFIDGSVNG